MKTELQYVSDEKGQPVSVIVPIDLWRDVEASVESARRLAKPEVRERLLVARARGEGVPLEEACEMLGISDLLAEAVAAGPLKEGE